MNIVNYLVKHIKLSSSYDKRRGDEGEKIACRFLKANGYRIVEKNFRTRFGEIDIIAREEKTLAFIEVKARKKFDYGLPEEFVDRRKQQKLYKTASIYLLKNSIINEEMRFDVVAVDLTYRESRLIKNAIEDLG